MSAITAKASRKMKKYAVLTREPRCFLGSFDFSWEQRKLGDIGKARSGVGFPDADQGGVTGVPFFKVSDMNLDGNENEMIVANNYVTAEQIADHRWSPITELPAIFFAKVGAAVMLNRKRLCRFPFLLDNNTMAYSLSPTKWDADFAKALFGTVDLTSLVQVGALPSYNAGDVESMGIYLPSLFEQEQIGAFFKLLDNLITLHQRKCANLCSPSQVVFSLLFATSTFSWEQRKLSDLIIEYKETVDSDCTLPVLTSSKIEGVVLQEEHFGRVQNHDITGYNILPRNYCTYRNRSDGVDFTFNINRCCDKGIISKFYPVFYGNNSDIFFISMVLNYCDEVVREIAYTCTGTGQKVLSFLDLQKMNIRVPSYDEQKKISQYFEQLNNLITLHQRECISFTGRADRLILTANKKRTTSSWEQRKAKELFVSTADKGYPELPVLSATQDRGMIRRDENSINIFHDKKNEAGYKRVLPGQFVIHLRSFQGGFAHSAIEGITSPAYTVFGFSEPEKHDSEYWKYVFTSKPFIQRLETVTYGIRDGRSISYEEFLTLGFVYPSKAEQTAIARYLDKLSDLITLHQRKPFLMKWRTSDANRNQTNRLVL